jgi:hypothetical protein
LIKQNKCSIISKTCALSANPVKNLIGGEMSNLFEGQVHVYLEGQKVLELTSVTEDEMIYYLGSKHTNLIIKDFRREPNFAARQILDGNDEVSFADTFNQPAKIKIQDFQGKVEITMLECKTNQELPTLWMGVIRDGTMPVHRIDWEVLRPVDQFSTAFAALVDS